MAQFVSPQTPPFSGRDPLDDSIRPQRLDDFIGQEELRANLRVYLGAARERGQAMDHVLFYGNPGWARPPWPESWPPNWGSI